MRKVCFALSAFLVLAAVFGSGCKQPAAEPASSTASIPSGMEYLGKKPPGMKPELFAPELFKLAAPEVHSVCQFSPDGREVYWSIMGETFWCGLYSMKLENGAWTKPEQPAFTKGYLDDSPTFSPDGKRLFFVRLEDKDKPTEKQNIYYVDRTSDGWSAPVKLPDAVNSYLIHWQMSIASNGDLYFGALAPGETEGSDIYVAQLVDGKYATVTKLGPAINSEVPVVLETCPYIARDGSYLLFSRVPSSRSYADMYVSFKQKDGSWGKAVKFDSTLNGPSHEMGPWVSYDGKYLFFTSMRSGASQQYWVDAKVIENARPQ